MKKILFATVSILLLSSCSGKNEFETAVREEMQKEQDVKDYKIDPEKMTGCVIDTIIEKMPGFYDFDPYRLQAYKNYSKMLTLMRSPDPKKTLEELRKDFGSPKALADAHGNYTEAMMHCYSSILAKSEEPESSEKKAPLPAEAPADKAAK